MNQQLIDYIKNSLQLGRSEDVIRSMLKNAGWQEADIEEAFTFIYGESASEDILPTSSAIQKINREGTALIYNFQNLPLSPRKVIKKTIAKIQGMIIFDIMILIILLIFASKMEQFPGGLLGMMIFLAIIILPIISTLFYEYLYYKSYFYEFKNDGAVIRKGVISRATGHVRYERLQNIYIDQDIWDRIFGLYDIHYETAGETSGFYSHVDGLVKENADKLINFLNEKVRGQKVDKLSGKEEIYQQKLSSSEEKIGSMEEISVNQYPLSKVVILTGTINMILFYFFISLFVISALLEEIGLQSLAKSWFIALGIFSVFAVFIYIYNMVWYKNFYFHFGKDKGEIRTKVIGQSTSYLYYDRIQNINISQGIVDRLFGIYKIMIETAGEKAGSKLFIIGLPQDSAEKIKTFLLVKARYYQNRL